MTARGPLCVVKPVRAYRVGDEVFEDKKAAEARALDQILDGLVTHVDLPDRGDAERLADRAAIKAWALEHKRRLARVLSEIDKRGGPPAGEEDAR